MQSTTASETRRLASVSRARSPAISPIALARDSSSATLGLGAVERRTAIDMLEVPSRRRAVARLNDPLYSTQPASRARDAKIEAPIADFKDFFIFDHGERLGERGTRYNFLPYQWSARVPILAVGPGVKRGYVDRKGVSLVGPLGTL